MSNKAIIYKALTEAAASIDKVNLLIDLSPGQPVDKALASSATAFDRLTKGKYRQAAKVKRAVQTVSAIATAIKQHRPLMEGDDQMLHVAAKTFREVAATLGVAPANLEEAPKRKQQSLSSFSDLAGQVDLVAPVIEIAEHGGGQADELNVADLGKQMEVVRASEKLLAKLPKTCPEGKWIVARAPILMYSSTRIPDVSFLRPGIEDYTKIGGALSFKRSGPTQHGYLLHDQLVVGFNVDDALFDKERMVVRSKISRKGLDPEKRMKHREVKAGVITRAIDALSARLGAHFNVMSENETPYLVMPGNKLAWVWLLPVKTGRDFVPKLASVSFPKLSPENFKVRQANDSALKKELEELRAMRDVLAKKKQVLEPEKLTRFLELESHFHQREVAPKVLSPEEKRAQIAKLRVELDKEVEQKFAAQFGEMEDLKLFLQDVPATPEAQARRLEAKRKIKKLEDVIAAGRLKLAEKYRKMLK